MNKPESLIFDMDGTLWDGVPTYAKAWNMVFQERQIDKYLHPNDLYPLMGLASPEYLSHVLPELSEREREEIYAQAIEKQYTLISREGGKLFEGVEEGISELSRSYPLMILSNCPQFTIHYFLKSTGLAAYFTDHLSYGESPVSKAENIHNLLTRNKLNSTVYVGDTDSDSKQAHMANVPFAFVSYGFGTTDSYQLKFDSFNHLTSYFLSL